MRRWLTRLALLALLAFLAFEVVWMAYGSLADRKLAQAVAEADRLDPGWRWEDHEKARPQIPAEENAALHVLAAGKLLPNNWPHSLEDRPPPCDNLWKLPPDICFEEDLTGDLRRELDRLAPALAEARQIIHLPRGQFPLNVDRDWFSTPLPHINDVWRVALLLQLDALLHSQDRRPDEALAGVRGAVNAGRALGDEPFLFSVQVRVSCQRKALSALERALGQGEPSEAALRETLALLENEDAAMGPAFLSAVRGERAGFDQFMNAVESGELRYSQFNPYYDGLLPRNVNDWLLRQQVRFSHAEILHQLTENVEVAKLPLEQQTGKFRTALLDEAAQSWNLDVAPDLAMTHARVLLGPARLRVARAALAAELFRRSRKRWPNSLDELVSAGLLHSIPLDAYDGKPIRMRTLPDGLVFYSVGPDRRDNLGHLDRQHPMAAERDIGFQLWDVPYRRTVKK
jgi:hypothetical protein